MKRYFKVICLVVVLGICAFAASGCNTMEGLGQDIKAGGEAIEDAANGD